MVLLGGDREHTSTQGLPHRQPGLAGHGRAIRGTTEQARGPLRGSLSGKPSPGGGMALRRQRLGAPWLGYSPESLVSCPDDFRGAKPSSCAPPGLPSSLEASPYPRECSKVSCVRFLCFISCFFACFWKEQEQWAHRWGSWTTRRSWWGPGLPGHLSSLLPPIGLHLQRHPQPDLPTFAPP